MNRSLKTRLQIRFGSIMLALFVIAAAIAGGCSNGNDSGGNDGPGATGDVAAPTAATSRPYSADDVPQTDEEWAAVAADLVPAPKTVTMKGGSIDAGCGEAIYGAGSVDYLRGMSDITVDPSMAAESYTAEVDDNGIKIIAADDAGAFYALNTLSCLLRGGRLPRVTIEDSPSVLLRGVIEGFYGVAWTVRFRLDLLEFMGKYKLNTYIYAPKDDAKHRERWRAAYTGTELAEMQELVETAAVNQVKFVYALSPGLDIDLGSGYEKDLQALFDKCESLYNIGVRYFAILLDDINSRDAEGHAKLLNDFQARFIETHEGCGNLIAISPEFCTGMQTVAYTNTFAANLNSKITMMWTGSGVIPQSIVPLDVKPIGKKYGSSVLIWWNYPVNDTMADNLFLGPCENLSPKIQTDIAGLVSNPMNQGYASMLPLITISDYLWNTDGYDADKSLVNAARALMPGCADELLIFAGLCRGSLINNWTSTISIADDVKIYNEGKAGPETYESLLAGLDGIEEALKKLKDKGSAPFVEETGRWIDKALSYVAQVRVLFKVEAEALRGGNEGISGEKAAEFQAEYEAARDMAKGNSAIVSTDVLAPLTLKAWGRINELLNYGDGAVRAAAVAISDCRAYEDYVLDNINDGDDSTYFWTQGTLAVASDNGTGYIGLDLGKVIDIENVYITTGFNGRDVLETIIVETSEDGSHWTKIASGRLGAEVIVRPEGVRARYVRLRNGDNSSATWVIVRSFEVNTVNANK